MERKLFIEKMEDALKLEESHTPLIARFYTEEFDWGRTDRDAVLKVKSILEVIGKQTLKHGEMVREMITWAEGSDSDEL